jgi:hypothetical protein
MPITPPFFHLLSPFSPGNRYGAMLQNYFRSGWAFLIPYLAAYLLYAWLKWPVNPVDGEQWTVIPCLLHVYWGLHATHLVLGVIALRSWCKSSRQGNGSLPAPGLPSPASEVFYRLLPWIFLGLIFWIPGAYLEWPSDPWEHFARISRWKEIEIMPYGDVGSYYKPSFYYFAYSILGHLPVYWQLSALDVFEATVALLVSWQFYRLARTCGLTVRISMLATLVQALIIGNDIFGFYRYYGLSSTAFSLLGSLAFVRIGITVSQRRFFPLPDNDDPDSIVREPSAVRSFIIPLLFALILSTLNHIQGLAIAGLGCLAVVIRHGIKCHARVMLWVIFLLIAASIALVLYWPVQPPVNTVYRTQTWLNVWFGFDIFSPTSNAGRRVIIILGIIGLLNVGAGIILACRNHIVGWLTITPLLVLELPLFSLPLANYLAKISPEVILVFHRLIFAIPPGLALVTLCATLSKQPVANWFSPRSIVQKGGSVHWLRFPAFSASLPICTMIAGCLLLVCMPASYPYCNRAWNIFSVTPDDLKMKSLLTDFYQNPKREMSLRNPPIFVVANSGVSVTLQSFSPIGSLFNSQERLLHGPPPRSPSSDLVRIEKSLETPLLHGQLIYYWPKPTFTFTPQSHAGFLSQHWNPAEVALAYTAK